MRYHVSGHLPVWKKKKKNTTDQKSGLRDQEIVFLRLFPPQMLLSQWLKDQICYLVTNLLTPMLSKSYVGDITRVYDP